MLQFIALFAPPLIGVGFYNHLCGGRLPVRTLLVAYATLLVTINLCIYMILLYVFANKEVLFSNKEFIDYLLLASLFCIIMPLVLKMIETSIHIDIQRHETK